MGRYLIFLSIKKHRVVAGALFYKAEGEKHCIMRKAIPGIKSLYFVFTVLAI